MQNEHSIEKKFNLLRWFALLSPIVIGLSALANGWIISSFLESHMFQREAAITRDFVQNILVSDGSLEYLYRPDDAGLKARFNGTIEHFSNVHDLLRANVYSVDKKVLWSTDQAIIGQRFAANEELDDALQGQLIVHSGRIDNSDEKDEHVGLDPGILFYVESYIPIVLPPSGKVVGVVEFYKAPRALTAAIMEGNRQVVIAALLSALGLYACLFWLIRRADRLIERQRARLTEAEAMAVVGELTSSVAHNIRNPLSSIRAAAEMALESPYEDCSEYAKDIVRESERISDRITELLRLSGKGLQKFEQIDVFALLADFVQDYQPTFKMKQQTLEFEGKVETATVFTDRVLLLQAFQSLLSNASEAMEAGGRCSVRLTAPDQKNLLIEFIDGGCGMEAADVEQVFRPFYTTKPKGLGLGLPLARRIIERFGGELNLSSRPGVGTTVSVLLPMG